MIDDEQIEERGEAVLSIFRRGADFMKQLIGENEVLREELRALKHRQNEASQSPEQWEGLRLELRGRIEELEDQNKTILEQLKAVDRQSKRVDSVSLRSALESTRTGEVRAESTMEKTARGPRARPGRRALDIEAESRPISG